MGYQAQLITTQDNEQADTPIKEETHFDERKTDDFLVYLTIKKRLEEISKSLVEVDLFPEKKPFYYNEPIHFQCICVFFVEPDSTSSSDIKSQTFRITTSTKVFEIINAGLELWEHTENLGEYRLLLIENEFFKTLNEGDVINGLFKANKPLVKSAKFILAPKLYKTNFNDIQVEDQGKTLIVNQVINKNEKFDEFIQHFTGISKYIELKYFALKEEELSKKISIKKKKELFTWLTLLHYIITALFFILFFIFSFVALIKIKNPFRNFVDYIVLKSLFMEKEGKEIKEDIKLRLNTILYEGNFTQHFKLASMARFSFYKSNTKECIQEYSDFTSQSIKCYKTYYKRQEGTNGYLFPINEEMFNQKCEGCIIYSSASKENNYIINSSYSISENSEEALKYKYDYEKLKLFLQDIFRGFLMQNYEVKSVSIKGDYGYMMEKTVLIYLFL